MSKLSRKQFLLTLGTGLAAGLIPAWLFKRRDLCSSENAYRQPIHERTGTGGVREGGSYGSMVHPPNYLTAAALDRFHLTSPPESGEVKISMTVTEQTLEIAHHTNFDAWTFDGMLPAKIIRVREGTRLKIHLKNLTTEPHSLHFHGSHDPVEDGWEPVPAGGEAHYSLTAGPVGLHPYHCHVPPLKSHIGKGLYGLMIIDPPAPRAAAFEQVLIFSSFDLRNSGKGDLYAFNGVCGFYDRYPIKVKVGELVRLYLLNVAEHDPLMSFHIHAQTFDVFRTGTSTTPSEHTDVVSLAPMERAIIEFRLKKPGRYMFHPHQSQMAENGGMGWIVAV